MNSDLAGRPFRSKQTKFSLGDEIPVEMAFLAPARHMTAPEVTEIDFVFEGTVTPDADVALLGMDAAKLFKQIKFTDEAEMVNASGAMLRLLEQVEVGNKQRDPIDVAAAEVPVAGKIKYKLRLLFKPLTTRTDRPRDTSVPLAHFIEGGNLNISLCDVLPTGWGAVANDWKVQTHFKVEDGRVRELKSRRKILEQAIQEREFNYQINGSLRCAIIGSKLTDTGYTDLSTITTIYSATLDLPPNYETHMIVDDYVLNSDGLGANDEFEAGFAIPLKVPRRSQKIGAMIDTKTLHIDLNTDPLDDMRLLTDVVVDRTPNMAALGEGYGSAAQLAVAVDQHGVTVGKAGNIPTKQVPPDLARRLPIRVKAGK